MKQHCQVGHNHRRYINNSSNSPTSKFLRAGTPFCLRQISLCLWQFWAQPWLLGGAGGARRRQEVGKRGSSKILGRFEKVGASNTTICSAFLPESSNKETVTLVKHYHYQIHLEIFWRALVAICMEKFWDLLCCLKGREHRESGEDTFSRDSWTQPKDNDSRGRRVSNFPESAYKLYKWPLLRTLKSELAFFPHLYFWQGGPISLQFDTCISIVTRVRVL